MTNKDYADRMKALFELQSIHYRSGMKDNLADVLATELAFVLALQHGDFSPNLATNDNFMIDIRKAVLEAIEPFRPEA